MYFEDDWTPRRLGERDGPPPARVGASGVAIQRLAREFKITWAPLWVRTTVYLSAFVALALVVAAL